jgi:hypothetical protein
LKEQEVESNQSLAPPDDRATAAVDWQGALEEREAQARELIRAHPVAAVLGAAALGFVIARLVRGDR